MVASAAMLATIVMLVILRIAVARYTSELEFEGAGAVVGVVAAGAEGGEGDVEEAVEEEVTAALEGKGEGQEAAVTGAAEGDDAAVAAAEGEEWEGEDDAAENDEVAAATSAGESVIDTFLS